MPLPLIPLAAGGTALVAAGAALSYWLTSKDADPWEDKTVFNARMRDMQAVATALQSGFASCPAFTRNPPTVLSWRGTRDGFSKFYADVGKQVYFAPPVEQVAQAKDYASKLYYWTAEYNRLQCGGSIPTQAVIDSPVPTPPAPGTVTNWEGIIKWSVIGVGTLYVLKSLNELFGRSRS